MALGLPNVEQLIAAQAADFFRINLRKALMVEAEKLVDQAVAEMTVGLKAHVNTNYDVLRHETNVQVALVYPKPN